MRFVATCFVVVFLMAITEVSAVEPFTFTTVAPSPTAMLELRSTPPKFLTITKDYLRCMYYDGKKVQYLVFADGTRYKIPCLEKRK